MEKEEYVAEIEILMIEEDEDEILDAIRNILLLRERKSCLQIQRLWNRLS